MHVSETGTEQFLLQRRDTEFPHFERLARAAVENKVVADFERAIGAPVDEHHGIAERHRAVFMQPRKMLAQIIGRVAVHGNPEKTKRPYHLRKLFKRALRR